MTPTLQPRLRVLFLEDNTLVRSVTHRVLAESGREVFSYPDPTHCPLHRVDHCHCTAPEVCADVLITDLDMPQVSGLQFIEELVKKDCRIRHLAVLSGSMEGLARVRELEPRCKTFMKPEEVPALLDWLDQVEATLLPGRSLAPRLPGLM